MLQPVRAPAGRRQLLRSRPVRRLARARLGLLFNFSGPCSRHDSCYHYKSVSRYTCDVRFHDEMDAVCHNSYAGSTRCYILSDIYYGAVRAFGWLRY